MPVLETINSLTKSKSWENLFHNADNKITERRAWLSKAHVEGKPFRELKDARMFYLFQSVLPCFWSFLKMPESAVVHDGGKCLCGFEEVHGLRSSTRQWVRVPTHIHVHINEHIHVYIYIYIYI